MDKTGPNQPSTISAKAFAPPHKPSKLSLSRLREKVTFRVVAVWLAAGILLSFAEPDPPHLLAGMGPVLLGEVLRLWATGHLEKNRKLTVTGPYAHVKNPLYIGSFLIMVGFCIMAPSPYYTHWILLGGGVSVFVIYYAPRKMCIEYERLRSLFGEAFEDYNRSVPDYIPLLSPYRTAKGESWRAQRVIQNSELWIVAVILAGTVILAAKWKWAWRWIPLG